MRVLLISANAASTPYSVYPLGMSMVAASLWNAGHEVQQCDLIESNMSMDAIADTIRRYLPEIIGISIRNIDNVNLLNEKAYIEVVGKLVQRIREETEVPVILGGSGFSIMPETILRETGADFGIVGEGEASMLEFVENGARGAFPEERCIRAPLMLRGGEIPRPKYDDRLMEFYLKSGNIAAVQTKRGCTHSCVYCSYPVLEGSVIRCRDPKAVVDDIEDLAGRHKAGHVFFTDSVFNDDEGQYLAMIREMKERGVSIPWTAFFKPEGLDEESVQLMKQTGLQSAEIGADASTDTTLRKLGKSFRFKDIVDCNDLFGRHDIGTVHFFMFGSPGETQDTVLEGIDNIKHLTKTVSFIYMGVRILPGTPLAGMARREGLLPDEHDLLKPVYYIAPGIDRDWLEKTLRSGFAGVRNCVFPPDRLDSGLQFLYRMGHVGFLWNMVLPRSKRTRERRTHHGSK